ncbi:MAG: FAD-dependent monooxygenase [Phycisphaerae bacterium]|nr:FAD-dependent monooxygenase [Phycisphaerae bacterium]
MTVDSDAAGYDVIIVGAGPAGATAACLCAKKGLSVGLVDYRDGPRAQGQCVWVNAEVRGILDACGVDADAVLAGDIDSVTFHSATFDKQITARPGASLAFASDRGVLENALLDAATTAGATLTLGRRVTGVDVQEESVRLTLSDETDLNARFLVGADGARSLVADHLGLAVSSEPAHWQAQWDTTLPASRGGPSKDRGTETAFVLGLIGKQGIGYLLRRADHLAIGVAGKAGAGEIGEYFEIFAEDAARAGLLPKGIEPAQPATLPTPAGAAIEMETHVGKRSLLVGDAGGFVTPISYEGIYPGMWSASIAADVIADAASSATAQDVLGEYDARWRTAMADYLRLPNTDLHFLLPLIFANQQMADRMAGAMLAGQNI